MKDNGCEKESLESLITTISNYDNKAGTLLAAVGVTFGFSLFSIGEVLAKTGTIRVVINVLGILYFITFVGCILSLALVVFPRRRTKKEKENKVEYQLYLGDLYQHLKARDLEAFLNSGISKDAVIDQIKVCSRIARTKETLLRIFSVLIVVFSLLLVSILVCLFL